MMMLLFFTEQQTKQQTVCSARCLRVFTNVRRVISLMEHAYRVDSIAAWCSTELTG